MDLKSTRAAATARPAIPEDAAERLLQHRLAALRVRIDEVDLELLRLLERRGQVVEEVMALKRSTGTPTLDAIREEQILSRLRAMHKGPYEWQAIARVFRLVLEISRGLAGNR
jgi:3-deoxy-7-phosphoheptulonate synthase / chorismate mutase